MSKGFLPCKRFLNGRTEFRSLAQLLVILKKTARDRTVQREAVWLHIKDKCSKYISNVTVGYGKAALLHLIELSLACQSVLKCVRISNMWMGMWSPSGTHELHNH